ncbi:MULTISPECIES: hypothetical protein [unclassified Nonomuraea]|uniref:hypothetical protein n=1 Tax=unclassified Nonomuraea TaxID=2593643 RepID=UPI0033D5B733
MRDDQAPHLPEGRPYPGYEGPLGFADVDGGYPVDVGDSTGTQDDPDDGPAEHQPHQDAHPAASPGGRRLHNPLPPVSAAADDHDDWYDASPPSTDWARIVPIGLVLTAAVGVGIWLAIPTSDQHAAPPSTPSPTRQATTRPPREVPSRLTATARPTPWWTPSASSWPSRTTTPTRTPSPKASPSRRPTATTTAAPVTRRPQPTITVTRTVKTTTRASPTLRDDGPVEPPGTRASFPTGAPPSATCETWSDCHDEPPGG